MTVLDHVPFDRITREAREVHFTRTALTALAGLLWLIGFAMAKAFALVWFAAAWAWTAIRLGWSDARPHQPRT